MFPVILIAEGDESVLSGSVSALGRLEPQGGITHVAAALTPRSVSGARVSRLLVAAGDRVEDGQLLAVMDTAGVMEAVVAEAQAEYDLSLRQVESAVSRADESCVQARVAEGESERRAALLKKGMAGAEEAELAAGRAEALAASCNASRTEINAAQAMVKVAAAKVDMQHAELQRSFVFAPHGGMVLEIVASPGELAAAQGVLQLARVEQMYAIAEIYETDIGRVRVGQAATVRSDALPRPLRGSVEKIRFKVAKQDEIGTDPAARKDARIVEVEIRLEDSALAADLTYLQVDVLIQP